MEKKETTAQKNDNNLISESDFKKSNTLIQSKSYTTLLGNKVIALGLYNLQKGNYVASPSGGNLVVTIKAAELREKLNKSGNSLYRDLEALAKRMLHYELGFTDPEKDEFRYVVLITEIEYKNGNLAITFNGDMKQYIYQLKGQYTILNLPLMLKWTRTFSFRLYEILLSKAYKYKDNDYNCEVSYSLAELKFLLGYYKIDNDKVRTILKDSQTADYEKAEQALFENSNNENDVKPIAWYELRRSYITPAVEEINSTKEANMVIYSYEPQKRGVGGKVYGITFKYRVNVKQSKEFILTEDEKFDFEVNVKSNILGQYKLPIKDIRAICSVAGYDDEKIQHAAEMLKEQSGDINNITGWLISCIEKDFSAPVTIERNDTFGGNFNNFTQRDYTKDEIEQLELDLLKPQLGM